MMAAGGDLAFILAALFMGLAMLSLALLRGWEGWLQLRRLELSQSGARPRPSPASQRLELIDLKDRVKRLEAIADGIDGRI
jgi:hypothetical protein